LLGASTALGDHLVTRPLLWRRLTSERALTPDRLPDMATLSAVLLRAVGCEPEPAGPSPMPPRPSPTPPRPDTAAPDPGGRRGHSGPAAPARAALTGPAAVTALREAYRDALLELAAADVGRGQRTGAAGGADGGGGRAAVRPGVCLAVIAMGKCGGHELNYVSDVDVIFVAERPTLDTATRLAATMMRAPARRASTVDAALRPEGKAGPLVRTLEPPATTERWAKTWEFQALLKARPVAGDAELGTYVDA
jgi:glutamate-ammonia-ligase adenylyltransferase